MAYSGLTSALTIVYNIIAHDFVIHNLWCILLSISVGMAEENKVRKQVWILSGANEREGVVAWQLSSSVMKMRRSGVWSVMVGAAEVREYKGSRPTNEKKRK